MDWAEMKDRRPRYGKFRGEVKNCERDWSFKLSEAVVKHGVVSKDASKDNSLRRRYQPAWCIVL
jgi:hypothetical protein